MYFFRITDAFIHADKKKIIPGKDGYEYFHCRFYYLSLASVSVADEK
jgi:hypothetical protein